MNIPLLTKQGVGLANFGLKLGTWRLGSRSCLVYVHFPSAHTHTRTLLTLAVRVSLALNVSNRFLMFSSSLVVVSSVGRGRCSCWRLARLPDPDERLQIEFRHGWRTRGRIGGGLRLDQIRKSRRWAARNCKVVEGIVSQNISSSFFLNNYQ